MLLRKILLFLVLFSANKRSRIQNPTMSSPTFAHIHNLSLDLQNLAQGSRAMHTFLCKNIKLARKVLTRDLLSKLVVIGVGTNEVENCVKEMSKQNVKPGTNMKLVRDIMRNKLEDATYDERRMRRQFLKRKIEYQRSLMKGSLLDMRFHEVMKYEVEKVWMMGKEKSKDKIDNLVDRYAPREESMQIRGVMFTNFDLENMNETVESDPVVYDNIELDEDEKAAMRLHPNYMLYDKIDEVKVEVEIEKALAKARYSMMNKQESDNTNDTTDENNSDEQENEYEVFSMEEKAAKYANFRVTDLPSVQRLYPPKPATISKEVAMQSLKEKILNKVREFKEKKCNNKGWIKKKNVSKSEEEGLKKVKERIKSKEIVVFSSDKSSKLTVDTVQNYTTAISEHAKDDTIVGKKKVQETERRMNQHLAHFNKMFRVGSTWGHEERIAGASTSSNVPPPPKYGVRKDHKTVQAGREQYGPAVRPICGANEAPNSKFSHFLSMLINNYGDCAEHKSECKSSEEMRAAFEEFNNLSEEIKTNCQLISMDVKALYPSMKWTEIIKSVKEMILKSPMTVENVDWVAVARYKAVQVPQEEIYAEGLTLVIPKRKKTVRMRRIRVNYLRNKKSEDSWTVGRKAGNRQKKKMLALAISVGVETVMSGHTYMIGDVCYLQTEGGAIGLELTGAVSRPFMQKWDNLYVKKAETAGIPMRMYSRYVDDSNQIAVVPPPGSRYDENENKVVNGGQGLGI